MKVWLVLFALTTNLVFVDQLTKRIAEVFWKKAPAFSVIPGVFNLTYVENRGCAWGMFQGQVWPLAVFGFIALVFLIWKRKSVFDIAFAEPLLYAGIIGNILDRVFRGYVIDMLDFHIGVHHFPCFNFADSCITTAVGLLLISSLIHKEKKS